MKKITGLVVLAVIAIILVMGCNGQRKLVTQDEGVKNTWAKVQSSYQKRSDLVGQLVETVKGVANFEKNTLTEVIEARAKATSINVDAKDLTPEKLAEFQKNQSQLSGALGRLMVVAEQYPQLKATENFRQLQSSLEGIENGIKADRDKFNDSVKEYNITTRSFPMNLLAGVLGFKVKDEFKADAGAEKAPKIDFNDNKTK